MNSYKVISCATEKIVVMLWHPIYTHTFSLTFISVIRINTQKRTICPIISRIICKKRDDNKRKAFATKKMKIGLLHVTLLFFFKYKLTNVCITDFHDSSMNLNSNFGHNWFTFRFNIEIPKLFLKKNFGKLEKNNFKCSKP